MEAAAVAALEDRIGDSGIRSHANGLTCDCGGESFFTTVLAENLRRRAR